MLLQHLFNAHVTDNLQYLNEWAIYQTPPWNSTPDLSYPAIILSANIPVVVACVPYFWIVDGTLSYTYVFPFTTFSIV